MYFDCLVWVVNTLSPLFSAFLFPNSLLQISWCVQTSTEFLFASSTFSSLGMGYAIKESDSAPANTHAHLNIASGVSSLKFDVDLIGDYCFLIPLVTGNAPKKHPYSLIALRTRE